jgi:hypothetical protein
LADADVKASQGRDTRKVSGEIADSNEGVVDGVVVGQRRAEEVHELGVVPEGSGLTILLDEAEEERCADFIADGSGEGLQEIANRMKKSSFVDGETRDDAVSRKWTSWRKSPRATIDFIICDCFEDGAVEDKPTTNQGTVGQTPSRRSLFD